jgi:RNA-directed DNA polymerase
MMHEPEESDSVVVAGKPTNKVERSTAELVEPRTETKGTAGQQGTRRAQDRESVSQALERVREAARQRRKGGCSPGRVSSWFVRLCYKN